MKHKSARRPGLSWLRLPGNTTKLRWLIVLVGLTALILAHAMALLYRIQPAVSLWFPPSGVAIALTLWFGPVGVVLTGIASVIMAPFWGSDGWIRWVGLTDAVEPLIAWSLYRGYWKGSLILGSLRDVMAFLLSAPLAACAGSAIVGSSVLAALGRMPWSSLDQSIPHWWLGNAIGTMAIVPTALLIGTPYLQRWGVLSLEAADLPVASTPAISLRQVWRELVVILGVALGTAALTVREAQVAELPFQQLSFLSFLPILWAATRFGAKGGVVTTSIYVLITLLYYLLLYPYDWTVGRFPVSAEVLHVHKLSLLLQAAVALLLGTAMTERAATQAVLVSEQIRRLESEKRAHLSDQLLQLNQSLSETNERLAATNQTLQQSEERFRASVESMLDCFGIFSAVRNSQGQITDFLIDYVNDAACAVNYMTRDEQVGKLLCELFPAHHPSGLFADYCQVVETGQPLIQDALTYEDTYGGQQHLLRAFNIRAAKFGDGFVATWRDITSIKQAEVALRNSEARLRRMVEANILGIFFGDLQGHILDANDAFLQMLGYARADLTAGRLDWSQLTPPDHQARSQQTVQELRQSGVCVPFEQELFRRDGSRVWVQMAGAILEGTVEQTVCYVLDLSERKQMEAERAELLLREQAARQQAETASRMKDEFLAIVSHELRSPLNAILGWSRLLRTRQLNPETTERALEVIERNAQAQTQLIEDLLDISRIIRGKIRLNLCPVLLAPIVEAALDTIRPTAGTKQIQLISHLDPSIYVSGDADRLQQVVWNLLSNAVKFTPDGGQVSLRLEQVGSRDGEQGSGGAIASVLPRSSAPLLVTPASAQLTVSDTGVGIEPEFLPFVFERFRQADSSTSRLQGGLGLGLAIVRSLVELHGGTIQVTSAGKGKGATFTLRLPRLPTALSRPVFAESQISVDSTQRPLSGVRVLVVDDEADTRDFLAAALEHYGAVVTTAASAQDALQMLPQLRPQVLLSDIGMPSEDGYSLIRRVRDLPPEQGGQTPAAALTAYVREADQQQALAAGFQRHVSKPIDPLRLLAVVVELAGVSTQIGSPE